MTHTKHTKSPLGDLGVIKSLLRDLGVKPLLLLLMFLPACREEVAIPRPDTGTVGQPEHTEVAGFFLLNEGNMGSNKATLDYYDYATATYTRNVYPAANPGVPLELGDVGNDLHVYGSRLYAVLNCSNKVEVMRIDRSDTCTYLLPHRIGQVDIPNCRYLAFHEGYAYVTSYAGPVQIDPAYQQLGYVAKVDTATLQVVATCTVGFQPDELAVVGDTLYVANSGGYMFPDYENTLSVIDLNTFTETRRIPVADNLHRVRTDRHGQLWVTSRGNYADQPARLFRLDPATGTVTDTLDFNCSDLWIDGDSLYFYSQDWSGTSTSPAYGIVDIRTARLVSDHLITDGTDAKIDMPYGIMVHPATKDFYITDSKGSVTPGILYCFSADGKLKWQWATGDVPAHFALVWRQTDER